MLNDSIVTLYFITMPGQHMTIFSHDELPKINSLDIAMNTTIEYDDGLILDFVAIKV